MPLCWILHREYSYSSNPIVLLCRFVFFSNSLLAFNPNSQSGFDSSDFVYTNAIFEIVTKHFRIRPFSARSRNSSRRPSYLFNHYILPMIVAGKVDCLWRRFHSVVPRGIDSLFLLQSQLFVNRLHHSQLIQMETIKKVESHAH